MKKGLKLAGGLLLAASLVVPVTAGAAPADTTFRVLIKSDEATKANLVKQYGKRHDFAGKGFTTEVTQAQFEALSKNKNLSVSLVETVSVATTQAAPVTAQAVTDRTPWGIESIYNNPSITATTGGAGVTVAVLDTGVEISHPDLVGQADQCKDFTQRKSPMINGSCNDKNGHGSHVAGTVLAHGGTNGVYGVAPEASLWAYKVLNDQGSGYSDDISNAIKHAADQAVSQGKKVIISMSLGAASKNTMIADAVTYAYGKGVLVVAAAGNSGPNPGTIGYPGGLSDAVAVAALENVQANGTLRVADFSSRGFSATAGDYKIGEGDVEVSAPGRAIESTWPGGTYNTISGTSMATPHVSGLAAKIWASNPSMTAAQLRAELQNRAKAKDIAGGLYANTGDDIASGFGYPTVAAGDN